MSAVAACSSTPVSQDAATQDPAEQLGVGCEGHTTPVSTFTLPASEVGQTVTVRLEPPPHTDPVSFTVDGQDAGAFSVVVETSGRTDLVFVPTDARTYVATVVASTSTTVLARLSVTATAVVQAGPLQLGAPVVELGADLEDEPHSIVVGNRSSAPIAIEPMVVTSDNGDLADVVVDSTFTCPSILQPGETCTVSIFPRPTRLGCRTNRITIHGSTNTVTADVVIPVSADVRMVATNGLITTSVGPTCAGDCVVHLFDSPVVATAQAATGFRFIGWTADSGCSVESTCTLRFGTRILQALFASDLSPQTTITFAGDGHGHVEAIGVSCDRDCTISALQPEDHISLLAATNSGFGGWTGACASADPLCNLGTPVSDQSVTATFDKDPLEVVTLSPPIGTHAFNSGASAAFLANGDIVVSNGGVISRMTSDRTVVWSHAGAAGQIVVTPDDTIVYVNLEAAPIAVALDHDGNRLWMRAFGGVSEVGQSGNVLAVTSAGDIAVLAAGVARVVDAPTGVDKWTKAVPLAAAIAADHAGVIAMAGFDASNATVVRRYTLAGDEILPAWTIGNADNIINIAFDTANALVFQGGSIVNRYDSTGSLVFTHPLLDGGVTVAGTHIVTASYGLSSTIDVAVTDSTGGLVSSFAKLVSPNWYFYIASMASDSSGRVAIVGDEGTSNATTPVAEILQIPAAVARSR